MSKKINYLLSFLLLIVMVSNTSAGVQAEMPTHLDDNFESYTNDSTMFVKWGNGPWGSEGVTLTTSLSLDEGYIGSHAIQMDVAVDSGSALATGLGENWEDCSYGIMGRYIVGGDRVDMTDYAGIRLWIKPGTITGVRDVIFKINLTESSTRGSEKWMGPKVYVDYLDTAGQYIYFDFGNFYEYSTGSGEPMDRFSINSSYLWLTYDNVLDESSTATIWVDDIKVIHKDLIDDFEGYASDAALQTKWEWSGVISGDNITSSLDITGGADGSQAMAIDFTFSASTSDPWGYVGCDFDSADWSAYNALSVWVKASTTGDVNQVVELIFKEGDSGKWGDKFQSTDLSISDLDPAGEYVKLAFADFVRYGGHGGPKDNDGIMDLTDIRSIFVFSKLYGTALENSSVSILIDDIIPVIVIPSNQVDDFELFESDADIQQTWFWGEEILRAVVGDSAILSLDTTGGANGSKAMKLECYFSAGDKDPWLFAGGEVRKELRNWSNYDSLRVWFRATETGDTPMYLEMKIDEGDSASSRWGDKFHSSKAYIKDLDPAGQYVNFAFDDFVDYSGHGGPKDDGVLDLIDIRGIIVFVKYDGMATQSSKATVWVDDITLSGEHGQSVQSVSILPEKFVLYQNFPNPFNPVTNILYDLSEASDVKLIIYDILGREIVRLVDDKMDAGPHSVVWNGKDRFGKEVATGVYIYRMNTRYFSTTKKLVLIK